jgi:thiol-disulfide isomerase/thioredoxin
VQSTELRDELARLDGLGQAKLVRAGEVSPAELVEAAIERAELLNPRLNAVIHTLFEPAREAAARAIPEGPLTGVPFLLKDLGATLAGQPTVLWFWAPWCPKCLAQGPETADVAAEFDGRAQVVGVAGLDSAEAMKGFVDKAGVGAFPHLADETGDIWRKFEITEQSVYVLLDQDGIPVYTGNLPGGQGLADKLGDLLG